MISISIELTQKDRYKTVYREEGLSLLIEKKLTTQALTRNLDGPRCRYFTYNDQGHARSETFEVLESADNWFEITEANDDYTKIKGNFEVTLIKTDSATAPYRYPDTLVFKNGTFDISY